MAVIVAVLFAVVVAFNIYASWLVLHQEDDAQRRVLQLVFVWLLPLVGAGVATAAHRSTGTGADPALDYAKAVDMTDHGVD